jgi:hypothetical protein
MIYIAANVCLARYWLILDISCWASTQTSEPLALSSVIVILA